MRGGRRCPGDRRGPCAAFVPGRRARGPNPSNCLQIVKKIQKPYGRQRWRALGCGGPRPCPHREPRGAGPGYCRLSAAARAHSSRPSWSALRITDPSILREGDLCRPGGTGHTAGRTAARPPLAFSRPCRLFRVFPASFSPSPPSLCPFLGVYKWFSPPCLSVFFYVPFPISGSLSFLLGHARS